MPLIQPKQIDKLIAGRVAVVGFTSAGGASDDIAAPLTTALTTAGDGGVAVPLQVYAAAVQPGVNVTVGQNTVEVYATATKTKLDDGSGNEVYGRITNPGAGVWRVDYFSSVAGVETSFTAPAGDYDYVLPYVFTFETLPTDFATVLKASYVQDDPAAAAARVAKELLTPTALNTLPALSNAYSAGEAHLIVNGQVVSSLTTAVIFTPTSTAVTWDPLTAGYNLETTDSVIAVYPY